MELEQPMAPTAQTKTSNRNTKNTKSSSSSSSITIATSVATSSKSSSSSFSTAYNDLSHHCESFRSLEMGVPSRSSSDHRKKLSWLRSQIIGGNDTDFTSPFGLRRLTYADHTASARSLRYIENFIIDNILPYYGNTHSSDSYVGHRSTKMLQEAGTYIKRCLGGKDDDDAVFFCGSGTTAAIKKLQEVMGVSVPSILRDRILKSGCLGTQERWVVFVGPFEHHSNLLSWRQSLAEVVEIGLDHLGLVDMEELKSQLQTYGPTNRPMLGSFSACSNVTGIYSDTRKIAQLLHQHGAFACFDFAASGPYVDVEMRSGEMDGYDAIFLSPHKFIGGPGSPGVLLMSKALYQLTASPPSTCGGGTVSYVNGFDEKDTLYLEDIEERESGGTPQIIQITRAALAFWVKEYIGPEVIHKHEQIYIQKALDRLVPNPNILVLGNIRTKRQAILSFLVHSTTNATDSSTGDNMWRETGNQRDKPLHGPFVAKLLNDLFGVQARGGCACAGPYGHSLLGVDKAHSLALRSIIQKGYAGVKPGWTRISFPYYMSNEEFEFILASLEFIAIYGQRFLPLYHFDWRTGDWTFMKTRKALEGRGEDSSHIDILASAMQAIKIIRDESKRCANAEDKDTDIVKKYATYLEIAKHVANLLPKFPSRRKLPDDIDLKFLQFRV